MCVHIGRKIHAAGTGKIQAGGHVLLKRIQDCESGKTGRNGRILPHEVPSVAVQVQPEPVAADPASGYLCRKLALGSESGRRPEVKQGADALGKVLHMPRRDVHRSRYPGILCFRQDSVGIHVQIEDGVGADVVCRGGEIGGVFFEHRSEAAGIDSGRCLQAG